jgi:predicted DCC family thiol-disulfide oxidoreductase YuxK
MDNIANKRLLYDGDCPLCASYTSLFVRAKILNKDNRMAFGELTNEPWIDQLDKTRQGNEIPLIDTQTGKTIYGLDALVFLLGNKYRIIKTVFRFRPLYHFFKGMYAMISYNRRIILAKHYQAQQHDCAPSYHVGWRMVFVLFAAVFSSCITLALGRTFAHAAQFPANTWGINALLICGTGWIVQQLLALIFLREKRMDYFGHLATLQLVGVLVLLPAIVLSPFVGHYGIVVCGVGVVCSSALMLRGHYKRTAVLQLSQWWTIGWFVNLQITASAWMYYFFN